MNVFEEQYPESLPEIYTQETITRMIKGVEDTYKITLPTDMLSELDDEIFLKKISKDINENEIKSFLWTISEIKIGIEVYIKQEGKNFIKLIEPEEQKLMNQMDEFNKTKFLSKPKVLSVISGVEYQEKTKDTRSGIKKIVDQLLSPFNKKKS